jgi:1,4-dihydroxy-6-naphthoate synthase
MAEGTLRIGHSPDPDDAFMFCALSKGAVRIRDFRIEHALDDIETLNHRALAGELEVTAVSAHAYMDLAEKYWILATGASMGEGYGPVVIAKTPMKPEELRGRRVAIPGEKTTAALLAKIFLPRFEPVVRPFDRIFDTVARDEADAGVLIHEGQLTYQKEGFHKVEDFGERWAKETGLPLPLGLDVVRKDLGRDLAREINGALRKSIEWAYQNEEEALTYALQFGRGLKRELGRRFVKMYVSDLTKDMGDQGKKALEELYSRAQAAGVVREAPAIELIR